MTDLTPETLAEWRKDAETDPDWREARRIIALLDALAAEKATREESERREADRSASLAEVGRLYEHHKARANKAEQESSLHKRRAEVHIERELSSKARVAALEAGINALIDMHDQRGKRINPNDLRDLTGKESS